MSQIPAEVMAIIDRAAIENLLADYYAHIGTATYDFGKYFAADGVLDVNGLAAKGAEEIKALYVRRGGGAGAAPPPRDPSLPPRGKFVMQMSNLKIEVNGDIARAELFWNSVLSATLVTEPKVTEYGHDLVELGKRDGRWLIKRRIVTSYGGMPESLLGPYKARAAR